MTTTITATGDDVRQLLAGGSTLEEVVETTGWPHQQIRGAIKGTGWLWGGDGRVFDPQRPGLPLTARAPKKPAAPLPPTPAAQAAQTITMIPVEDIEPHPKNVRKALGDITELADSIRVHGLLQPLVVQPHPGRRSTYQIIAGHRRRAAAQLAGLTEVPAVVRAATGEDLATILMLIENVQREDLNPMDKAEALGDLRGRGYTQQRIGERTGIPMSTVAYFLTLLDLDKASQDKVRSGQLAVTHAVTAVRKTRAKDRKRQGSTADYTWEPDYLSGSHPLAKKARKTCDAREHSMRRRLGDVACGQCWETVIRQDERAVIAAAEGTA